KANADFKKSGKELGNTAKDTAKKTTGSFRNIAKKIKGTFGIGALAIVVDEFAQFRDDMTGETVGLIEGIGMSLDRGWDFITGKGAPTKKIRGMAQLAVEAYGEEIAKLPVAAQN